MTGDDLLRDTGSFNSAECDLISGDDDCTARSDGNNSFLANCDGFSSRDEGCARMAIQEEDAAALQFGPVPIFITFPVKPEKPPPQIVPHPRSYSEVIEASQPLKYYVRRTARPAGTSLLHSNHQLSAALFAAVSDDDNDERKPESLTSRPHRGAVLVEVACSSTDSQ